MLCNQLVIALGFAPNDWRPKIGADHSLECGVVGRAVVNPHLQGWKLFTNAAQGREIAPVALDRVEIGDIKRWEGIDREKAAHDIHRVAGWRERGFEPPVRRPVAHPRADDLAPHEVNDWDNPQRDLPGLIRQGKTSSSPQSEWRAASQRSPGLGASSTTSGRTSSKQTSINVNKRA